MVDIAKYVISKTLNY